MYCISSGTVQSGWSIIYTVASMTSPRLWGGMFVAMPTAMPMEPLTSRFGNREGSTSGSLRVLSKFIPYSMTSFSMSTSISLASRDIRASVYR